MTKKRTGRRAAEGVGLKKLLGSLTAVTLVGVVGFFGTQAAISDATENPGNEFNAGAIDLVDNDLGAYMYQVDNVQPGDSIERCIRVSYTGTINSNVKLFMTTPLDGLAPYVDMTVDVGTQGAATFPDCTAFSPVSNIYTGTLGGFQTTHPNAAGGLAYSPNGVLPWTNNDSVVYRVTLTLQNVARDPGADFSGTHTYTWQAESTA